jgi:sorbitol-specific phosphotransferase system component IIBC
MKFSINSLSPLAKLLIGMTMVLVSVFLKVASSYPFIQGVLEGGGIIMQLFAVIDFFKKRKLAKQSGNLN